jgi:hypothetical protein
MFIFHRRSEIAVAAAVAAVAVAAAVAAVAAVVCPTVFNTHI